jgi:type IV secretion system protein VirB3
MSSYSPVFLGLLREPQFFGVDYHYAVLSLTVSVLAFLNLSSWGMLLFFPLHVLGWLLCRVDPHIFPLMRCRARLGRIKNIQFWGVQSYDPS